MGELLNSDEELNAADIEQQSWDSQSDRYYESSDDDRSLQCSDDEQEALLRRKAKEAKVNNSFTGPYPVDPADFGHNDKGPNF